MVTRREEPQLGAHAAQKPVKQPTLLGSLLSYALIFVVAFGVVFLLRTFVFQVYQVPTGSMESTIMEGDMVFTDKVTYLFRDPQPGDVITFQDVQTTEERVLIKRLIAVAGQTVDIVDGKLYVDGVLQDQDYVTGPTNVQTADIAYPYTIPEGYVWVMGDNRVHSADSRTFGAVPVENIMEHADVIYWPLSRIGSLVE